MPSVAEVSTLFALGSGMDGHPGIMHGGIVSSIIDEAMGILMSFNHERDHDKRVREGKAHGEKPLNGVTAFTAELKISYKKPVTTPGVVISTAKYVRTEGMKTWIVADVRQRNQAGGEDVMCATGEALFVEPRRSKM